MSLGVTTVQAQMTRSVDGNFVGSGGDTELVVSPASDKALKSGKKTQPQSYTMKRESEAKRVALELNKDDQEKAAGKGNSVNQIGFVYDEDTNRVELTVNGKALQITINDASKQVLVGGAACAQDDYECIVREVKAAFADLEADAADVAAISLALQQQLEGMEDGAHINIVLSLLTQGLVSGAGDL